MVTKGRIFMILMVVCLLVSCVSVSFAAADFSPDPDHPLTAEHLDLFQRFVSTLPEDTHYVFWRDSPSQYCLVYSPELDLVGDVFGCVSGQIVRLTIGSTYYYTYEAIDGFTMEVNGILVYSDLGPYPPLITQTQKEGVMYVKALVFAAACACVMWVFMRFRRALSDGFRFVS